MQKIIFLLTTLLVLLLFSCKEKTGNPENQNPTTQNQVPQTITIPDIEMISLPPSTFSMGSVSGDADETPPHTVILSKAILMGKYEITNAQVASVYTWGLLNDHIEADTKTVGNTRGEKRELLDIDYPDCQIQLKDNIFTVAEGFDNHPCTLITWYGTILFCNLLSLIEGKSPVYDVSDWSCSWTLNGYRLPTEAEWEFAARGGEKSKGFKMSGSNNPDEIAWYEKNSGNTTHPVGMKAPNELGFHDMSGNVWECCWDYYGYYIPRNIGKESFVNELLTRTTHPDQRDYLEGIYIQNSGSGEYEISPDLTNEENRKTWELLSVIGYKMGPQTDPTGIRYRNKRVLRGGDWGSNVFYLRHTYRGRVFPQISSLAYGFRIVRINENL